MNEKKIHELIGRIRDKEDKEKVYTGKWAGTYFYRLNVIIENKLIFAFKDKIEKEQVWKDIEEANYIDKRYLFYCEKNSRGRALVDWKELTNHGSN